jgi:hypothetical protein
MSHDFRRTVTARTETFAASFLTDFYNTKSKAAGARRIGYRVSVVRTDMIETPEGERNCWLFDRPELTLYRAEFQTTLDGARYQSSKHSDYFATEGEARAALDKTIAGASKRYAKLAAEPLKNKIEKRS